MSFLKYFSKKIYFLKSERDYKTIRKKNFIKRVRLICFYPKVSTIETFDDFFLTKSSDKKKPQKFLPRNF